MFKHTRLSPPKGRSHRELPLSLSQHLSPVLSFVAAHVPQGFVEEDSGIHQVKRCSAGGGREDTCHKENQLWKRIQCPRGTLAVCPISLEDV